jgi:hypothetical protein
VEFERTGDHGFVHGEDASEVSENLLNGHSPYSPGQPGLSVLVAISLRQTDGQGPVGIDGIHEGLRVGSLGLLQLGAGLFFAPSGCRRIRIGGKGGHIGDPDWTKELFDSL